jgi:hypothetical protein
MIKTVLVQINPQSEGDPGRVTEGFYKLEDGYLQMTFRDGRPLENPLYRVLIGDANPNEVAANLAKTIRGEMSGEAVPGFNRGLSYPKSSVA